MVLTSFKRYTLITYVNVAFKLTQLTQPAPYVPQPGFHLLYLSDTESDFMKMEKSGLWL